MDSSLTGLNPAGLWEIFDEIRQIPRCSKKEEKIICYLEEFASKHGIEYRKDSVGNIVMRKPGSPGCESAPIIVLQSHVDMVCEKNSDVSFDFDNDPIQLRRDGDWLLAQDTTLGSDNGIGLAASLAILLDPAILHGPLEVLCTIDEETGMTGANYIQTGFLRGRFLLNLDSEEEGMFTIGCAGGQDTVLTLPLHFEPSPTNGFQLKLSGMKGGHSGLDINLGRANAIKILTYLLYEISEEASLRISYIQAGSKRNAICREAIINCSSVLSLDEIQRMVEPAFNAIKMDLQPAEPDMKFEISSVSISQSLCEAESKKILQLLYALPHGVKRMSLSLTDKVETSTNLAIVKISDQMLMIHQMSRSSSETGLRLISEKIQSVGELAGASIQHSGKYPGWQPNANSSLVHTMVKVYEQVFQKTPKLESIHAGLETGIIGVKFPGMEMISIGPDIGNPHSPDEKVNVVTVEKFWKLLVATLEKLAKT